MHGIGIRDNFFDLGGHSLLAIRLLSKIEAHFGIRLPLTTLFVETTIEDLARVLRNRSAAATGTVLVPIQPEGAARPFYCVHPAGGIVYCYQELSRQLGRDRPFYGIQAPGLEEDTELSTSIEALAALYADALVEAQPKGPYHLGGWSLGGLVAYEMARQLRESGREVGSVALVDTHAPAPRGHTDAQLLALAREIGTLARETELFTAFVPTADEAEETDRLDDALVLAEIAREMAADFGGDVRKLFTHLRRLAPEAQRDFVLQHFNLHEVYALETGPERVRRLWNVLRANISAAARYHPGAYDGEVVLFRAVDLTNGHATDPTMGWAALAKHVRVHEIRGDHVSILKPPAVQTLAANLRAELERQEVSPR